MLAYFYMKKWFSDLTLKKKLLILHTLALIPWFFWLAYLAYQTWPQVKILGKEIQGARHLPYYVTLMNTLQRHRGLSYTYFLSKTPEEKARFRPAILELEKKFFKTISKIEEKLEEDQQVFKYLEEIKSSFSNLQIAKFQGTADENFWAHSRLILILFNIMEAEGHQYALFSDPDLYVRTLAEVALIELPKLTEILGRIRGLGSGYLARKNLSLSEKKNLLKLYVSAHSYAGMLQWTIKNIQIPEGTVLLLKTAYQQFEEFLSKSEELLNINFKTTSLTPESYFNIASLVIKSFNEVYRQIADDLIERFYNKKKKIIKNWVISVTATYIIFIFFCLSFYLSYQDVVSKLQIISKGAERIAKGDLSAKIELDSRDEIGQVVQVLNQSVERLKKNLEEIYFLHYFDRLTKLPNRDKLLEDITHVEAPALLLLDINNFKGLNSVYGEDCVGEVLKALSKHLRNIFPYQIYRVGPDEFAVLIDLKKENLSREDFFVLSQKGIDRLEAKPYFCGEDDKIYLSFFGAALCECVYPEKLLIFAYDALKEEERSRQKLVKVVSPGKRLKSDYQENMFWIRKIKEALREKRIEPFYQPIFNNQTEKIEKFEALVRIIEADGQVISPFKFLEVSKKAGIYPEITRVVIERTLDDFRDLPFEVSINLSFQDFKTPGVKEFLLSKVERASEESLSIEPQRMVFEILETEDIKDYELIANFLKDLKKRGCKIAIDDFGTGYSNLERLIELKVDYLKIDASLIKRLPSDENVRLLVEAILNFARRVGIKTIAEFVADETLFNLVKEMGIDYSQGYFIGPPEPIEVIKKKYL